MTELEFNATMRHAIEIGIFNPILNGGLPARILAWDAPGQFPIVCMADSNEGVPFKVDENGRSEKGAPMLLVTTEETLGSAMKIICEHNQYTKDNPIPPCVLDSYMDAIRKFARMEMRIEKASVMAGAPIPPGQVKESVAEWFKKHGLSMAEAGRMMGLSRATVSCEILKKDKYFTKIQANKYARVFGMDSDFLTAGRGSLISSL